MLRQPRRSPQFRRFKFRKLVPVQDRTAQDFLGIIKTKKNTRIFWTNFETLRLQLTWALGKKRRFSRKLYFKHKLGQKKKKEFAFRYNANRKRKMWKIFFTGFPHLLYTLKPKGSRMGKGKGSSNSYFYNAASGQHLIFIIGCNLHKLKYALFKAKQAKRYVLKIL